MCFATNHICILLFSVEQVTVPRLYFREFGAMGKLAADPDGRRPCGGRFVELVHIEPPYGSTSCQTEHVLRAALAQSAISFALPQGLGHPHARKFQTAAAGAAQNPTIWRIPEKNCSWYELCSNLSTLNPHSQNAFFTPFKHPLPDDPIAPIQTAGATSPILDTRKANVNDKSNKYREISVDKL